MKNFMIILLVAAVTLISVENSFAAIKWVNGYSTRGGQYRSGHYKDTSHDGNPYNNANYFGYNE